MIWRPIIRFLGGIPFALLLISTTALFTIAGTFIESSTGSHRYAALLTYGSPLFSLLLWGFFLNILISALRRYPFKRQHLPFLITHFGMLMVLAGVLIKSYFGVQGSMTLVEGSASDELLLSGSYALSIESKTDNEPQFFNFDKNLLRFSLLKPEGTPKNPLYESLSVTLLDSTPHSVEHIESWIKGGFLSLFGVQPLPVQKILSVDEPLPQPIRIKLRQTKEKRWDLLAISSDKTAKIAEKAYRRATQIIIRDTISGKKLFNGTLEQFLGIIPLNTPIGAIKGNLDFSWSSVEGFNHPSLCLELNHDGLHQKITIALDHEEALLNKNQKAFIGKGKITVDLLAAPTLLFLQNSTEDVALFAFTKYGQVTSLLYPKESAEKIPTGRILAYDDGYLGYTLEAQLPADEIAINRKQKENFSLIALRNELEEGARAPKKLSPPLKLLYDACEKSQVNFVEMTLLYLHQWDNYGGWLYKNPRPLEELSKVLGAIDWGSLDDHTGGNHEQANQIFCGCYWNACLFEQLDPLLVGKENDLGKILKKLNWPLLYLNGEDPSWESWPQLLQEITLNIFSVAPLLPGSATKQQFDPGTLLSAYLRVYGLHLSQILSPTPSSGSGDPLLLETPLSKRHQVIAPTNALEANIPCVALRIKKGAKQELLSLSYDKFGSGLKWPVLDGEFLVRFQPLFKKIPYRLRLRQARQVNYANSQQPYSFESDLLVTDKSTGQITESSISMNSIYETWDGYRFYLSNISPQDPGSLKRIQIVVNRDPGKYFLTYPGAFFMTLGIFMLFFRPKRLKK
ncbi:MAG: cytochrome c biogenesis protein ResB [Parachlamydiaceae bacterium]|nr:cytochrome c biogenesis protein ResB [Parachlamydiaceae bacterium]